MEHEYIFQLSLIFFGSAVLGTIFLSLKQPMILAYILVGLLAGPYGFKAITNIDQVHDIGKLGIVFLLFLLGLNLPLKKLITLFKQSSIITCSIMFILFLTTSLVFYVLGFNYNDSLYSGLALMFSSTVIGLKLIPTTALHHQRIGAILTSVLLLGDLIAIFLISMTPIGKSADLLIGLLPFLWLLLLIVGAYYGVKYVLLPLFMKYDIIQEYMFLLSLGWCFLLSQIGYKVGISHEIGAFVAGTTLATSPIALLIADRLNPIREFFLILFFFAVGARFDYSLIDLNLIILAVIVILIHHAGQAILFYWGFRFMGEPVKASKELGVRLGNVSEFALLIGASYFSANMISNRAFTSINFIVILSFIVATYWVVKHYPTPISNFDENPLT